MRHLIGSREQKYVKDYKFLSKLLNCYENWNKWFKYSMKNVV